MKPLLLVVMGSLLIGTVANASEIISDNQANGTAVNWPGARSTFSLTQNLGSPIALSAGVYTCGNVTLGYTTESWSLRRFSPYWDAGLDGPLFITSVDWGVRRFVALLDSVPNPITVDVELYSIPSNEPLIWANLTAISATPVVITIADNPVPPLLGTWKNTAMSSPFDPLSGAVDLVVAIHQPEGYSTTPTTRFACSADNPGGQTAYPYYVFADCGFPEPTTSQDLNPGSPEVAQLVLIVNGETAVVPMGACCNHASGDCTVTVENDCYYEWLGFDVPCNVITCWPYCPLEMGACCNLATGECMMTEDFQCSYDWLGHDVPCNVQTCPVPVPIEPMSWGQLKSIYRDGTR